MLYGKTNKQLKLTERREVLDLMIQLDLKFESCIQKETEKIIMEKGAEEKPLKNFSGHSWALPSHIIVFLKNAIENIKSRKCVLSPWPEFKKTIF